MSAATELTMRSLAETRALLATREISPLEVTRAHLARIDALERRVRAFATIDPDRALRDAARAERALRSGKTVGPLTGIPIALKDLINTAGMPTEAGSRLLAGHVPGTSATVAQRLENAGTVLLGKTTTHEFAMDVQTPPTRNPWRLDRIPGGSSGGSAAALAARMCLGAIGTDTAGSIRIPSALCGVTGLKPTFGRVSRAGVIPFSWTLDHVGPMARDARDVALLLEAIAGPDPDDPTTSSRPVPTYQTMLSHSVAGIRVGVPLDYFFERVDSVVENVVRRAIDDLASLGAALVEIPLPTAHLSPVVGDTISFPEASAYHASWQRAHPGCYTPRARTNLQLGELVLATDYVQALRLRSIIRDELRDALERVDVIVTPTTPVGPIALDADVVDLGPDGSESPLDAYCRLTYPANVTGLPALTVPCGFSPDGLPVGLQLVGKPFDEGLLLRLGAAYQQVTDWHLCAPTGVVP